MKKYACDLCDYVYDPAAGDPDNGVPPNTAFEDLPDERVHRARFRRLRGLQSNRRQKPRGEKGKLQSGDFGTRQWSEHEGISSIGVGKVPSCHLAPAAATNSGSFPCVA